MTNESSNSESVTNKALKVAQYLRLTDKGKESFVLLCEMGCDAEELGNFFKLITSKPEVKISSKRGDYNLHLRPMDSLEVALGRFNKRTLDSLSNNLKKIAIDIQELNNTILVRRIDRKTYNSQIANLPQLLNYYAKDFLKLVLREKKKIGSKQKPGYTMLMKNLYKHIRDSSKEWHDALVADVLNALLPEQEDTEQSLKQWRKRHGVIEREGTQKRNKL
jgi:hypothetical protein